MIPTQPRLLAAPQLKYRKTFVIQEIDTLLFCRWP